MNLAAAPNQAFANSGALPTFGSDVHYGLRALVSLAQQSEPRIRVSDLARREGLSRNALSRALRKLRDADLVTLAPTGYSLARPSFHISVWDVLSAFEDEPQGNENGAEESDPISRHMAYLYDRTSIAELAGISAPLRFPVSWRQAS